MRSRSIGPIIIAVLLIACSFFVAIIPSADADVIPPSSEIILLDQDYTAQAVIPSNVVLGNLHKTYTDATLTYNTAARAIEYYTDSDESGSAFVGIEPFINGNLSISLRVNSDSTWSSVNIQGSTFWLEVRTLSDGSSRVISYYMPTASTYSYKTYDVPASAMPNGVNTINIMVSGTTKTLTVYHDATRKVTTPMYHWSVQKLPYAPITSPIICFDNYISSVSNWASTYIYGIKETVSGGLVSAVPGNGFVPFGIDYPRSAYNSLGTQHMISHGQKGVAWVDLQWLEYQPQDKAYIDSLLAAGWELGIHYNASLNSYSLTDAQNLMRRQNDQVKALFGRAPTSWCSYQNADSVTHATYGYQQLGMIWRNGYSGVSYLANVGNLQETRWTEFWSKISAAGMVYPCFTHKTDQVVAESYAISSASFTKWVDNYAGKKVIGFNEYYYRVSNQIDTKVSYLDYTQGSRLKFSVDCNAFQSRLMIDFPGAQTAVVLKNGGPLTLGPDYTVLNGRYIVLFANDNDVFEVMLNGPPTAPRGLTAVAGNAQVALNWTAPASNGGSSITGYKIYRSTVSGAETLLSTVGNVLVYTNTGLTNGVTYYYKVSAVTSISEGPLSSEVSAKPAAPITAPSAPLGLVATPGNAQVVLNWSVPSSNGGSAITGYKIYRGTVSGGEALLTTVGNVLAYTNSGLTNGVTYYYKVSAINSVGEGPLSSEVSAKPLAPITAPSAPRNLGATGGNAQVTLTWSVPSSDGGTAITGYKVYRGTASGSETLLTTLGNVLTYTDSGAANGVTYYYKVSASNSIGEGVMSNEASATPATVPSAPLSPGATGGDAQVVISWSVPASNGGGAVTGYKIYRGTTSGSETLLTTVGNVLSYTDSGVTNGQTYYYKVSAVNVAGEGPLSSEVSAKPELVITAPSAPQSLVASAGNGAIVLTWNAPSSNGGSPVTNYNIYRGGVLLATVGNVLTYTDSGLVNGQSYSYEVSAVNTMGEGPRSNQASATPASVPSAPRDLAAAPGNAKVVLTWSVPSSTGGSAVTGYKIYRSTTSGGETLLATVGNVLTYTDNSVTNGQAYYYKVSAVNTAGEGALSDEATATPATTPSAPRDLAITAGNGQLVLTWNTPASNGGRDITGYKVYRSTVSGSETLLTTLGNVLTYTDTGLTNGVTYYYKISAVNSIGEGSLSSEASKAPVAPATVPTAPQSPGATGGDAQVVLTWSAPSSNGGSSITGYKIYRGTASGSETLLTTVGNVLSYTDGGLVNGQAYYYKVSATNSVGEGPLSAEVSATPASAPPVGLEYELINGGTEVQITGYSGPGGAVTIPSTIEGKPVTGIADFAFYGVTSITSVTMSSGLQTIGNYGFYKCSSMTQVTLPAGLRTIGEYGFGSCTSLRSITIPGTVTSLGSDSFYNCLALTSVTLSSGLQTIGDGAFYGCKVLGSIHVPETVTTIANWAFAYTGVTEAYIPGSTAQLGSYAFYGCTALATVSFGNGIQGIGYQAFRGCTLLTSVTLPGSVTAIGGYAFFGCSSLASVTLSSGLRTIGDYAFYSCSALRSIAIPGTTTSIGAYAFTSCSAMTSVTLSTGLLTIGDHAFYRCTALTTITIPRTVTTISAYAFYGCSSLTSMYFEGNAPSVGTGWISARNASLKIYYHSGATGFTNPWQGVPTALY